MGFVVCKHYHHSFVDTIIGNEHGVELESIQGHISKLGSLDASLETKLQP